MKRWSVAYGHVICFKRTLPMNIWTSAIVNGVDYEDPDVYSFRRNRKKKARTTIAAMAEVPTWLAATAIPIMCRMMQIGIGLTRLGGGHLPSCKMPTFD